MSKDYYGVLEVHPRASKEVIHSAWRALVLKHADSTRILSNLNQAKTVLLDDSQRAEYDETALKELNNPKQIGQYKIVKLISETGGCAKTYLGEHVTLGTPVCIKHALKNSKFDKELMEKEASAMWDLRHWGIPAVRDIHTMKDGSIAIIMSYIPGPTLYQLVEKNGGLDPEHVSWITERLLNVLRYIHYHGVVHGDVKPQNVIIQPDTHTVVLVDYGLSAVRPTADDENSGFTPHFASPEQIDGRPLIPESDLYSLGKTMVFMLGGDADSVNVPKDTPKLLCDFMKRLIAYDVLARPNWHKEDLIDTFQSVRMKAFGRTSSGMKALKF